MNKLQVILDTWIEQGAMYSGFRIDKAQTFKAPTILDDIIQIMSGETIITLSKEMMLYGEQSNFFEVMFPKDYESRKMGCVLEKNPIDYIREHCDLIDNK